MANFRFAQLGNWFVPVFVGFDPSQLEQDSGDRQGQFLSYQGNPFHSHKVLDGFVSAMHMPDRSSEPQALIELLCEKEEAKLEELPEKNSRDGSLSSSKIGCIAPCDSGVAIVEAFLEVTEVTGSGCLLGGRLLASNTLVLCST